MSKRKTKTSQVGTFRFDLERIATAVEIQAKSLPAQREVFFDTIDDPDNNGLGWLFVTLLDIDKALFSGDAQAVAAKSLCAVQRLKHHVISLAVALQVGKDRIAHDVQREMSRIQGGKKNRTRKQNRNDEVVKRWKAGESPADTMKALRIKKDTYYRAINEAARAIGGKYFVANH